MWDGFGDVVPRFSYCCPFRHIIRLREICALKKAVMTKRSFRFSSLEFGRPNNITLDLHALQLTGAALRNSREQTRQQRNKILESIAGSNQKNDSESRLRYILLKLQIAISGHKNFKTRVGADAK